MKQKNKKILYLEEYNCGQCGENFYVLQGTRRDWDNNFGCAFGCDDAGKLIRSIEVLILEGKEK